MVNLFLQGNFCLANMFVNKYIADMDYNAPASVINNQSDSLAKIKLFMSLLKDRNGVYAKRWEYKNKGGNRIFTPPA